MHSPVIPANRLRQPLNLDVRCYQEKPTRHGLRKTFSWAAPFSTAGRSLLASGSTSAFKPTLLRSAAYLKSTFMQNKPLPVLSVTIHFSSCKSGGFLSDDFAAEIKKAIPSYEFKFSFSNIPNDALFPNGISSFSGENLSEEEIKNLSKTFQNIFSKLSTNRTG